MKTTTTNRVKKLVRSKDGKIRKGNVDAAVYAQRVEKKAYELYQQRGYQNGHDCDDWFEAERIIEKEMIAEK